MRINKYLALCGLGSRRKVEDLVVERKIEVNGKVVVKLATEVSESDVVCFKGKLLKPQSYVYYLVNKPVGYASTTKDPHSTKNVIDLVQRKEDIFPVGRLDKDSCGLIILTNNGEFAYEYSHPKNNHEKEYIVEAEGPKKDLNSALDRAVRLFKCGLIIDGYKTKPAAAKVISKKANVATFNIVLKEGRKRQIRRTLDRAGFKVLSLMRTRIDRWNLDGIKDGQYVKFDLDKGLDKN